jgi:hypothetical protein
MGKTNNRESVQASKVREDGQRKTELDAVRQLMSTPPGRFMAWRLLDATGINRRFPYTPNAMNLAHDVGTREMGEWLLEEIREACPELELVMRNEHLQREKRAQLQEAVDNE